MDVASILMTLIPSVIPAVLDGAKMIFSKLTGISMGEPKSFTERLELFKADTDRLKTLAELDRPTGDISRWVADLRASFRYIAIGVIILAAVIYCFIPAASQKNEVLDFLSQLAASALFFIIGDRVYFHIRMVR